MQHDCTIFTNRVQHDGVVTRGDNLAHDVDALRFKPLEVIEMLWANNVVFSVVMFCYVHHGINLKGEGIGEASCQQSKLLAYFVTNTSTSTSWLKQIRHP